MAAKRVISSVLIILHVQWVARCDFTSVDYFSKDLNFRVPANARDRVSVIVSTPESDALRKHFHFNYAKCDLSTSDCEVGQDCFDCPPAYRPKKCPFSLPDNDSLALEQATLRSYGEHAEFVVVDWATKAVVAQSSAEKASRKVQVIGMASCSVREIPIEISSAGNGMRKIVLDAPATTRDLEVFYVDYRACRDSGWVRASYREDGRPAGEPQCLLGLRKSKLKLAMDVAAGADSSRILLDKGERDWALYELKARSNRARELHRAENREGGLLDVARLAMHDDDFGSLCWLADLEPSYSLDCTIFRAEPPYARQLGLRFHYRLRDFELALVDFKRIYALTSSSDDAGCAYDLWIFDVGGRALDGPLRIQGPRCARGRRLEPRPALARRGRDEPCASFAFELAGAGRAGARRFAALTECLLHSDRGGRLLLT